MKKVIVILLLSIAHQFSGQTLSEYLVIAAENNPALKAKFNAYQGALEKVNQVGSLPSPVLDFGYFINPIETRNGPQQAKIGLMQMFPWMGTLSTKQEVAAELAKVKYEVFMSAKKDLFFRVEKTWYELLALKESEKIIGNHITILESYETLAQQKFQTGSNKGMVDVLRIQMELAEVKTKLLLIQDQLKGKKVAFNNLLNRDSNHEFSLPQNAGVLSLKESKQQLMDSISVGNNQLRGLDNKQSAYQLSEKLAKKKGMPMFGLGMSYFFVGQTDLMAPNSGKDAFMPMLSLSIPIYRKPFNAQAKEAMFMSEQAKFERINTLNTLESQLEMALVNYNDANRRLQLNKSQITKANQAQGILIQSYTNAGKDFEEILRVQRMLLKYDMEVVKATKDVNIAVSQVKSMQ